MDQNETILEALADAEHATGVTKGLGFVSKLAAEQVKLAADVASLEEQLKKKIEEHRVVQQDKLPKAMLDVGMKKFTMDDDSVVSITKSYVGTVVEGAEDAAYDWVAEQGHGGIIKVTLTVNFAKGELEDALELKKKMATITNRDVEVKRGVHYQTMRGWVREMFEAKKEIPPQLITTLEFLKAEIKTPKKKKDAE